MHHYNSLRMVNATTCENSHFSQHNTCVGIWVKTEVCWTMRALINGTVFMAGLSCLFSEIPGRIYPNPTS